MKKYYIFCLRQKKECTHVRNHMSTLLIDDRIVIFGWIIPLFYDLDRVLYRTQRNPFFKSV